MAQYHNISKELTEQIASDQEKHVMNPYASRDENIIRRNMSHDRANLWRPAYVRDIEKIMHNPYYNRYSDKTQVFSFYKNDDISRRALHVQLVSRVARNIGRVLNLNTDLIEAIALGHDIGHTPFGHAGERMLNELYHAHTGRMFNHNVHSARVLDRLVHRNISLQVLDGVLCHNGEMELLEYRPRAVQSFKDLDARIEACYTDPDANKRQIPCTLEGCVVRVSDIIAYLGKDRQDAERLGLLERDAAFANDEIGTSNAEIINNMIVNIIENSYGKPYLSMTPEYFKAFSKAKKENYNLIYANKHLDHEYNTKIRPMCEALYERLLEETQLLHEEAACSSLDEDNGELLARMKTKYEKQYVFMHHVCFLQDVNRYADTFSIREYLLQDPNEIVVDYIASMTDDYFLDLYRHLFPDSPITVEFIGYGMLK